MAGKSYRETISIQRSVEGLVLPFVADIKESIYRNFTSNGSVIFRNLYQVTVWKMPEYEPQEGDFVVYRNKILRVEGYTEDDLHRFQNLKCITLDDFSRTSEGARRIPLFNQVSGQVFNFIDAEITSTRDYLFICHFFDIDGLPVDYVGYQKYSNNAISLLMEPGVTISGTLIMERR